MGFKTGAYAKVWDVKSGNGNYVDIRMSVSRKDSSTGEYVDDFSGFVRCYGECVNAASKLTRGDRIKLGSVDVSQKYDKESGKTYTNFKMFSFEPADGQASGAKTNATKVAKKPEKVEVVEEDDQDLPF